MKWSRFSTYQQTWWRDRDLRFQIRHRREDDVYVLHDLERERVSFWDSLHEAQLQAVKLAEGWVGDDETGSSPEPYVVPPSESVPALGELHLFVRFPHLAWRYDALVFEGFSFEDAERLALATDVEGELIDWRRLSALVADGCDVETAEEILR